MGNLWGLVVVAICSRNRYHVAETDCFRQAISQQGCDNVIAPEQCKMARAGLGLGVRELAEQAGVSTNTIARLERGEELQPRTLAAIRSALEAAGVEFIAENGSGPGVRLKKPVG
jgi:DNA-binding XRE family transcriptional regulator